jgi:hypothetical protein
MMLLVLAGGCAQPVKDKAHDLGNAFSGNYDATVEATPADVIAATRGAVQDLRLSLISQKEEAGDATGIVVARTPDDEKVTVTITPQGDFTKFVVTTGVFGNSTLRQQVMDAIKLRLGNGAVRVTTQPS